MKNKCLKTVLFIVGTIVFNFILYFVFKCLFKVDDENIMNYNFAFLTFAGTLFVSIVSLYISSINARFATKMMLDDKFNLAQPRFEISVDEAFEAPYFDDSEGPKEVNSVLLTIRNISDIDILNVFFNDILCKSILRKDKEFYIVIPYKEFNSKRFCANIYKYYHITDDEDCIDNVPKKILLQYQDALDNDVCQIFKLVKIDKQYIYVKSSFEKV